MLAKIISKLKSTRFGLSALTLAAVNVLLLTGVCVVLIDGTQADAILATAGKEVTGASVDMQIPTFASDLEVIQAQPIFHVSRSFYVPPDPATLAVQVVPPDYRIGGAMALPMKPVIVYLVHNQTGARARVQKGDVLDGWQVEEATSQRVALVQDGHRAELGSAKPTGAAPGMVSAMFTPPANAGNAPQGGLRILSAGPSAGGSAQGHANPNSNANALPKAPPGGVGARLYRPPPGQ
jgi:hypothetical protein